MKVAIVEDDKRLLETYELLIGGEPTIDVVGTFTHGETALENLEQIKPDVMLVDIDLPGMSGIELTETVKKQSPNIEIIVHTVFEDRDTVFQALKAGAGGYIHKGASPRELIGAIHGLYDGGAPMSPKIARMIIEEFQEKKHQDIYLLTPREKTILKQMESGRSYKQISNTLEISVHTVHSHIKNIYEKLHATTRKELFCNARKTGVL